MTADPIAMPSTRYWTFVTLSDAVAVSVTKPETVEPSDGVMNATDGGVMSLEGGVMSLKGGVMSLEGVREVGLLLALESPTATVTWMVEFPRTLLILPTTASENESGPL